jgi:hypothetical protein
LFTWQEREKRAVFYLAQRLLFPEETVRESGFPFILDGHSTHSSLDAIEMIMIWA